MNPKGASSDGGGGVAVRGQDGESFSCSEGSRDPPSSKHSHSERRSMKRQERLDIGC